MTPDQRQLLDCHLPRLQQVFTRLVEIENNPDIDWPALLELREKADPLSDDSFYRGYLLGVLDALGVSVTDGIPLLRTPTGPKRRMVQEGGRQGPRLR